MGSFPIKEILRGASYNFRDRCMPVEKGCRKATLFNLALSFIPIRPAVDRVGGLVVPGIFEERHETRELLLVLPDQCVDVLMGGAYLFVLFVE